jgi:hypothetical protein
VPAAQISGTLQWPSASQNWAVSPTQRRDSGRHTGASSSLAQLAKLKTATSQSNSQRKGALVRAFIAGSITHPGRF